MQIVPKSKIPHKKSENSRRKAKIAREKMKMFAYVIRNIGKLKQKYFKITTTKITELFSKILQGTTKLSQQQKKSRCSFNLDLRLIEQCHVRRLY